MTKYIINGGKPLHGTVTISGSMLISSSPLSIFFGNDIMI